MAAIQILAVLAVEAMRSEDLQILASALRSGRALGLGSDHRGGREQQRRPDLGMRNLPRR